MIIRMRYQAGRAHVWVRVFTGPSVVELKRAGTLSIRAEDWPAFVAQMKGAGCQIHREGELVTQRMTTPSGEPVELVEADPSYQREALR